MVLFQGSDVVFRDTIVDIEGLSQSINVKGLFPQENDDASSVGTTSRTGQHVPK